MRQVTSTADERPTNATMQNEPESDDEPRYFAPGPTRNAQASTVDIREDAAINSADPELVEEDNPWLAAVVRHLYTQSTATVVNVYDASVDKAHLGVYDRSENDLSNSLLTFLQSVGFRVMHAKTKSLPYEVEGQKVYEQHAYGEFILWDDPAVQIAIDRSRRDRHRAFRSNAPEHPAEVGDAEIHIPYPGGDGDE